jgi:hypothetical protein
MPPGSWAPPTTRSRPRSRPGALGIVNSALLELNEYVTEQSAILSRTIVREEDKTRAHYSRLLGATSEH